MLVDGSSVPARGVDTRASEENQLGEVVAAEFPSPAPRRPITRVFAVSLLALAGLGGLIAALRLRSTRRRRTRIPLPSPPSAKARPLLVRAVLSAIDLRRRPPRGDASKGGLTQALRALRRPPVPRVLPYVRVKRINPRVGDTFGHWWIEIDGTESYGWWPERCPIRVRDFFFGSAGTVNGLHGSCAGGTTMTDPHHREPAQHSFHPTLVVRKSDRRVRRDIRSFAQKFTGEWRYSTKPTSNDCRSFQLRLLHAVGLEEDPEHQHTRGQGCPFLGLFRTRVREFAT
jgi:hypothetical protein